MKRISKEEAKARSFSYNQEQFLISEEEIDRVKALEKAIFEGNQNEFLKILEEKKPVFLSRALGIACALGRIDIVKILLDAGASFEYEYNEALDKSLLKSYKTNRDIYIPQYEILLTRNRIDVSFSPINVLQSRLYFGEETANQEIDFATEEKRKEVVLYLLERNEQAKMNVSEMLFLFLINGLCDIAKALIKKGVTLSKECVESLCGTKWNAIRGEWKASLAVLSAEKCKSVLELFTELLNAKDQKLLLTMQAMTMSEQNAFGQIGKEGFSWENIRYQNSFYQREVMEYLFECAEISKIKIPELIENLIEEDQSSSIAFLCEYGKIEKAKQIDKFIDQAKECGAKSALAWLIDYKNKKVDFAEEAKKMEKKLKKELNEKPDSVSALKKIWIVKKIDETSVQINGYKGTDVHVVIPATIGKMKVAAIGEDAFSPWAVRINEAIANSREKIKTVEIPETVIHIDEYAFRGCKKMEKFRLKGEPDSVTFLDCVKNNKKRMTVCFQENAGLEEKLSQYNAERKEICDKTNRSFDGVVFEKE